MYGERFSDSHLVLYYCLLQFLLNAPELTAFYDDEGQSRR